MTRQAENPLDVDQEEITLSERLAREGEARNELDGRHKRRRKRPTQISFKTTDERKMQIQRLGEWMNASMTEVIEAGIDALEEKLKRGKRGKGK